MAATNRLQRMKLGLLIVVLHILKSVSANFTVSLYPCLKHMKWLHNSTGSKVIPANLKQILTEEALRTERYVLPIPSPNHLCDYIEKKLVVVFNRLYSADINAVEVEKKLKMSNGSSGGDIRLKYMERLYLLSIESLISKVVLLQKTNCQMKYGTFYEKNFECLVVKPGGDQRNSTDVKQENLTWSSLAVFGNICSIACQLCLFITYWKAIRLETIFPRRCVLCLAALQCVLHIFQLAALYINEYVQVCTAVSILSHWLALCAFVWLSCVSYEMNSMLSERCLLSKEERFIGYSSVSFGLTAVIVLSCTILHFSIESSIGYGQGQICFIHDKWSMLYSYLLPISAAFLCSAIWALLTYRKQTASTNTNLQPDIERDLCVRQKLSMISSNILVSLIVLLTRVSETFSEHTSSVYKVTAILISLHGVVIFIGLIANRQVIKAARGAFCSKEREKITYTYKYAHQLRKQKERRTARSIEQTLAVI